MGFTVVYDVTGSNFGHQPAGNVALYVTGSQGVPATAAQLAKHPEAVLIDQTPASGQWDNKADVDDYERGAVRLDELAGRAKARISSFNSAARPGQRSPAVYASASNISDVVNNLIKGGVKSGVGLWVANWSLSEPTAISEVINASGPFPIIGVQFHNAGLFDISVFSTTWLNNRSAVHKPVKAVPPPGPWLDANEWDWREVSTIGVGMDGREHTFTYNRANNAWNKLQ